MHVWGQGIYGKSLYLSLNFAVNLKLFLKNKVLRARCGPPGWAVWASGKNTQPLRGTFLVEESRQATHGTPATPRTLRSLATQPPRTRSSTYLNKKSLPLTERWQNLQAGLETLPTKRETVWLTGSWGSSLVSGLSP